MRITKGNWCTFTIFKRKRRWLYVKFYEQDSDNFIHNRVTMYISFRLYKQLYVKNISIPKSELFYSVTVPSAYKQAVNWIKNVTVINRLKRKV